MRRTTIWLPEELHEDLRSLASLTRSSLSDLLRSAAEGAYSELFETVRGQSRLAARSTPSLVKLETALHRRKFALDRRFRWNRYRDGAE